MKRTLLVLVLGASVVSAGDTKTPAEVAADASRKLAAYQTKDARTMLDAVAGSATSEPSVAVALGRLLAQEKKYDESADMLKKALDKAPADPSAYVYLGETQLRAKKSADAEASFKKAAELAQKQMEADAKDANAPYFLGVALQQQKKLDDALAAFEKAQKLDPENALVLYQIGATKAFQEKWSEAVETLSKAVEKDTGLAYGYYYRGLAQEKLGKKVDMVLDMDRFVKLAPDAPEADRARAVLKAAKR